jgi:hypothetical protein
MIIITVGVMEVEAEVPDETIVTGAEAKVRGGNGRNKNIERVDTDVAMKSKKNTPTLLPCHLILPHLQGVTGMT